MLPIREARNGGGQKVYEDAAGGAGTPDRDTCPRCSHAYVYQTEYDCVAGDGDQIPSGPRSGVSFQLGGEIMASKGRRLKRRHRSRKPTDTFARRERRRGTQEGLVNELS